jgi:hypothetical protein
MADLAQVAFGLGGLDLHLILLDVVVDAFHDVAGPEGPEFGSPTIRGGSRCGVLLSALVRWR